MQISPRIPFIYDSKSMFKKVSVNDQWWKWLLSYVVEVKKKGNILDDFKNFKKEERKGGSFLDY